MKASTDLPLLLRALAPDLPEPVAEYKFAPTRRFRFDYAFPEPYMLAVELEGGIWKTGGGRHNRPSGYLRDISKYNLAAAMGWRLVRFTPQQLEDDPMGCIETIRAALRSDWVGTD